MIDGTPSTLPAQIALGLAQVAQHVQPCGPAAWTYTRRNGAVRTGTARLQEGWLLLDARCTGPSAPDKRIPAEDLLYWNGQLPGGVKYALDERKLLRIRAEWPVTGEMAADEVAALARASLAAQACLMRGALRGGTRAFHGLKRTSTAESPGAARLGELCQVAGWRYVERAGGRLAIDLQCGRDFHEALLGRDRAGLHCAVELSVDDVLGPTSRHALACLLLALGGAVRMVRPAVDKPDTTKPRLEVRLPGCATDAQIGHALAALSVACRWGAREVRALADERVAQAFLSAHANVAEEFPLVS